MLNKKLIVAALLAVAQADTETTDATTTDATTTDATTTDATTTDATTTDATTTDATTTGDATTTPAAEEPAAESSGEEFDFEKARKAWQEEIEAADGTKSLRVLCDQGETEVWEQAWERYTDLKAKHAAAVVDLAAAQAAVDPLQETATEMLEAKAAHAAAGAAYLASYTTAEEVVDALVTASGGTDGTAAALAAMNLKIADTTAAEAAVTTQRQRVEALVTAKRTQDQEEALWEERVTAANAAVQTALDAKTAATAAVTEAGEQVSTRSWLFEVLGQINAAEYDAGCQTGANPKCALTESAKDASTSTWTWPSSGNCNFTTGTTTVVTKYCLIKGLTALTASNTAARGTARVTTGTPAAPTELFLAYEGADYTYVSSSTQLNSADSSPLLIALDNYLAWQKKNLLAEMMKVACWKDGTGTAGAFQASDEYSTWCHYNDGVTGSQKFHPLLQGSANANSYVRVALDATTAQAGFGGGVSGTDKSISTAMQAARATAQVNLWFNNWVGTAIDEDLTLTGNAATKATESPHCDNASGVLQASITTQAACTGTNVWDSTNTWAMRTIGAAEATETSKTNLHAAAVKEAAAAVRWEAIAAEEAVAAQADLARAYVLLDDLTKEIAPIARAEADSRTAYDEAVAAQAVRVAASQQLGDLAVAANASTSTAATPATGARAVLAAALATKESIEAQQAFHDARSQWAADNLAPAALELAEAQQKADGLEAMVAAAEERWDTAREQCKSAAFERAQNAREAAVAIAATVAAKVADVKKDWTAASAFPTDGSAGTLCNYPKPADGEAQGARVECLEGEPGAPLCCGAAQRFLKDGTKLSIETCQTVSTTTYTYYPALPDGATVAPATETWRFQCISAAQKLAAAATAALAAGYMMA